MSILDCKRVLFAGKGGDLSAELTDGCKIIFHYRVQLVDEDETTIDDSRKSFPDGYGQAMEIILGKKFKLPIWETCLRTMKRDEIASFLLPAKDLIDYPFVSKHLRDFSKKSKNPDDHHHHQHSCMGMAAAHGGGLGYPALDAWIKSPTSLKFTFHVLAVLRAEDYEHESWTLNADEKLASVPQLRTKGNDLFRGGNFSEACRIYCEALGRLDALLLNEKPGEPEWKKLDDERIPFYLNIAQCKLRSEEFYSAIEAADEVLKRDPQNVKGLFRRAKAHAGAWNFDRARADYENLRTLDRSTEKIVQHELDQLNRLEKSAKADEANRFQKLFTPT